MKYLVVYDLEIKKYNSKIGNEDYVDDIFSYIKFLNAKNIRLYMIDFENELISEIAKC